MPTFGINILFYFVGRVGHVRIGVCGHAPRTVLLCYYVLWLITSC